MPCSLRKWSERRNTASAAIEVRHAAALSFLSASIVIPVAIGLLQCWLILHHSPWRDEEQALLIAKQPLGVLFGLLHYEGHPALYYLVLKATALLAPGVGALELTAAACSLATLGLIWSRSPFGLLGKIALSLNYLVFFEYGVIARSYGLGALLFFAFIASRRSRGLWPWVLLALLANVALHTAVVAAVCALWLLKDGRWSWRGAGILGIGAAVSLLTIWPAHDIVRALSGAQTPWARAALTLMNASGLLTWSNPLGPVAVWDATLPPVDAFLVGALFPLIGMAALRRTFHRALFALCFFALLMLAAVVYVGFLRHLGFSALLLIGLLWAEAEDGAELNATARTWVFLAALGGVWFAATALTLPFSASTALTEWATRTGSLNKPWAAAWGPAGLDLSGATGRPTFNLQKGCWNTFQRWNYDTAKTVTDGDIATFARATGGGYVISPVPLKTVPGRQLDHVFPGGMFYEPLYVYRVWPVEAVRPEALPTCG